MKILLFYYLKALPISYFMDMDFGTQNILKSTTAEMISQLTKFKFNTQLLW